MNNIIYSLALVVIIAGGWALLWPCSRVENVVLAVLLVSALACFFAAALDLRDLVLERASLREDSRAT